MPILQKNQPFKNPPLGITITVVVTCHTPRVKNGLLTRALQSVWDQTHLPEAVTVALDHDHKGAAVTRNRALRMAETDWVVFLDSDDKLFPSYLKKMADHQLATGADVLWPWFHTTGGRDPFPKFYGRQWDPAHPHSFPITALVRRELAMKVGGFPEPNPKGRRMLGEDFPFWKSLSAEGAKFSHLPERLWEWNHQSQNTSGHPDRW